jgi:VanZ family protein
VPAWLRHLSLLLAIGWGCAIYYLSSLPGVDTQPLFFHQDKLLHAAAFGALGFLLMGAFRPGIHGHSRFQLLIAIMIAGTYGILDEIHQRYVPGRMPDVYDILADFAGATLGVWLLHAIVKRRIRN